MTLNCSERDGYIIVFLPSQMEENDWMGLRGHLHRRFVDQGSIHIVIDCEACADLPSLAFGAFLSLSRDLRRIYGSLHLVHISERIRQVMTRTRMDEIIAVRGTLAELFRGSPPVE